MGGNTRLSNLMVIFVAGKAPTLANVAVGAEVGTNPA